MQTPVTTGTPPIPFTVLFGGIIAIILLGLYATTVVFMILDAIKGTSTTDQSGVIYIVTTIGGLVSALVVSKLTVTKPGENPGFFEIARQPNGKQSKWVTGTAIAYLIAWLSTGLAALIVGVMIVPDASQTLSDIGTTWLGLAVASGYAYFGINPEGNNGG